MTGGVAEGACALRGLARAIVPSSTIPTVTNQMMTAAGSLLLRTTGDAVSGHGVSTLEWGIPSLGARAANGRIPLNNAIVLRQDSFITLQR